MKTPHLLVLSLFATFGSSFAETTLSLPDGDRLTGKLIQFLENGESRFLPTGLTTPITLQPNTLQSVHFNAQDAQPPSENVSELITLANGDTLRCSLSSISESTVDCSTWFTGKFSVPRGQVSRIDFNKNLLATEPYTSIEWHTNKGWQIESNNNLSAKGKATIALSPKLKENNIIELSAKWETHQPDFKIHFCANSPTLDKVTNGYSLHCTSNQFILYRTSPSLTQKQLGTIRNPRNFRNNKAATDIKIEVDRKNKRVAVRVGSKRSVFEDYEVYPPELNHIILQSASDHQRALSVSNFRLLNWNEDLPIDNLFAPKLHSKETDTLIDREDRASFTGQLINMETRDSNNLLFFSRESSQQKIVVPFSQTHCLLFKKSESDSSEATPPYTLQLSDTSTLQLSTLSLQNNKVIVTHPILGNFSIQDSSLKQLTVNPSKDNE